MHRLIPQFLAEWWCGRSGHAQTKFESVAPSDVIAATGIVSITVSTCRCGEKQDVVLVDTKVQHPRRRA